MADQDLTPAQEATFYKVLSGEAHDALSKMKSQVAEMGTKIIDLNLEVTHMAAGPDKAKKAAVLSAAQAELTSSRSALNEAVAKYNYIVGQIIQYSFGAYNPGMLGLDALGVAPVVVALVAAGVLIAVAAALDALANLWATAQGHVNNAKGYLEQLGESIGSTSNLVRNVAILVAVAAVAYVGVSWYRSSKGRTSITEKIVKHFDRPALTMKSKGAKA